MQKPEPRMLTSHQLNPVNNALTIAACDERASDGANRLYLITGLPLEAVERTTEQVIEVLPVGYDQGGVVIAFQNGPITEAGVNGLTHEVLIAILIDRLEGLQSGPFASEYNANALLSLQCAQESLLNRTRERMARGVEGTHVK